MRWTDLPPDAGGADGGQAGLRRAQWEQLRQRLERLPAGHPSSPDGGTGDDDDWDDESVLDNDAQQGRGWGRQRGAGGDSGPPSAGHDRDAGGRPGGPEGAGRPGRRGGNQAASRRIGHADRQSPAAAGADRRGTYRPWFASGEPGEPWFASGTKRG